jgi:hypothetical protein
MKAAARARGTAGGGSASTTTSGGCSTTGSMTPTSAGRCAPQWRPNGDSPQADPRRRGGWRRRGLARDPPSSATQATINARAVYEVCACFDSLSGRGFSWPKLTMVISRVGAQDLRAPRQSSRDLSPLGGPMDRGGSESVAARPVKDHDAASLELVLPPVVPLPVRVEDQKRRGRRKWMWPRVACIPALRHGHNRGGCDRCGVSADPSVDFSPECVARSAAPGDDREFRQESGAGSTVSPEMVILVSWTSMIAKIVSRLAVHPDSVHDRTDLGRPPQAGRAGPRHCALDLGPGRRLGPGTRQLRRQRFSAPTAMSPGRVASLFW